MHLRADANSGSPFPPRAAAAAGGSSSTRMTTDSNPRPNPEVGEIGARSERRSLSSCSTPLSTTPPPGEGEGEGEGTCATRCVRLTAPPAPHSAATSRAPQPPAHTSISTHASPPTASPPTTSPPPTAPSADAPPSAHRHRTVSPALSHRRPSASPSASKSPYPWRQLLPPGQWGALGGRGGAW